jgi:hypothetical protein
MTGTDSLIYRWRVGEVEITRVLDSRLRCSSRR